jgi:hypothetical protein
MEYFITALLVDRGAVSLAGSYACPVDFEERGTSIQLIRAVSPTFEVVSFLPKSFITEGHGS